MGKSWGNSTHHRPGAGAAMAAPFFIAAESYSHYVSNFSDIHIIAKCNFTAITRAKARGDFLNSAKIKKPARETEASKKQKTKSLRLVSVITTKVKVSCFTRTKKTIKVFFLHPGRR